MSDETAKMARLMRATDAVIEELDRQGATEVMANLGFDPRQMAKAADGDVIPFLASLKLRRRIAAARLDSAGAIKICMSETGRRLRRNSLPWVLLGLGTTESKGENDVQARSCNIAVICVRICPG